MEQTEITEIQRVHIEHALGLNYKKKPWRNTFYTDADDAIWNDLVSKGYAIKRPGWDDESAYFQVTDEGIKQVYNI